MVCRAEIGAPQRTHPRRTNATTPSREAPSRRTRRSRCRAPIVQSSEPGGSATSARGALHGVGWRPVSSARSAFLGIDLGTTNSAAAVFDGEKVEIVRNPEGASITPSVVKIDARGNVTVGGRARRSLEKDPDNVRAEFKRLMGSPHALRFSASKLERRPEELSAEVLKAIREDVRAQFGVLPAHAVISVPALFELPQNAATSEAARLAGFDRVELIQEPVASAIAAGFKAEEESGPWLVYDLGGGTFDVSLLETQEGLLRVVGHDGDNFLGGRDFDAAIV